MPANGANAAALEAIVPPSPSPSPSTLIRPTTSGIGGQATPTGEQIASWSSATRSPIALTTAQRSGDTHRQPSPPRQVHFGSNFFEPDTSSQAVTDQSMAQLPSPAVNAEVIDTRKVNPSLKDATQHLPTETVGAQ